MTRCFGLREDHDIVVEGLNNGSVLGPVVSQIMNSISIVAPDSFLPHRTARVVWTCHKLDEQLVILCLKRAGVASPIQEPRLQILCHDRISLQSRVIQHPSKLASRPPHYYQFPDQLVHFFTFLFQLQDFVEYEGVVGSKLRSFCHAIGFSQICMKL